MSGRSFELAHLVSSLFSDDRKLKDLMYDCVFFLLDNQFVEDRVLEDTYTVVKGSGMGLPHSAAWKAQIHFAFLRHATNNSCARIGVPHA